jgi:predicted metalloendopeptidase
VSRSALLAAVLLGAAACVTAAATGSNTVTGTATATATGTATGTGTGTAAEGGPGPGLDVAAMDPAVRPGDDFYAFANGGWMQRTEIPADRSERGIFEDVIELNRQRTADLIKEIAAHRRAADAESAKIADYFASFMDEAGIEKHGLAPLRPALAQIAAIRDRRALARWLGSTLRADVDVLNNTQLYTGNVLGLWVAQDLDNPARYLPFLLQGGLAMPDRDYYLSGSAAMREVRRQYLQHIEAVFRLAHVADGRAAAGRVYALETRLAASHGTRAEAEDVAHGNNHWSRADFKSRAPGMDWEAFFAAAGLGSQQEFVVWEPSAVTGLASLAGSASLADWRSYLAFHALEQHAEILPRALVAEHFHFYGTVLEGTPQLRARWKRAVDATNAALGDAVGKLYVARYFPPEAKAQITALVDALLKAFAQRIDRLEWMAPATRVQAHAKLAALKVGVGYPDQWQDYAWLRVVRADAYGNAERAERFKLAHALAKLGRPVDRSEWVMTPQTVNAVNLPAMNALNFPAGILQPPFFNPRNPAALNFGDIGATIGHEISHSFDDQGAQFDADGRFRNWWTAADLERFRAAGARLAAQYDAYRPFPDLGVNGRQTLSENIADVAGLAAAYDAYRLSLAGAAAPPDHGYTGDQQFFIAYALGWRTKQREPALRRRIITNGHAPAEYRADTVRNIDAWYQAFDVQPGQKLYLAPAERVPVW